MDRCPVELVSEIFSLACTDGGQTGRSLALVSKFCREVVKPIQLQSITVQGPTLVCAFRYFLERLPPHHRRVKWLLLTDRTAQDNPGGEHVVQDDVDSDVTPIQSEVVSDVLQIISLVAPHVQRLSLLFDGIWLPSFIPTDMPYLSDLSIFGAVRQFSFMDCSRAERLQRLHIADYRNLPENLAATLARIAPNLTHLRISDIIHDQRLSKLVTSINCWLDAQSPPSEDRYNPWPSTLQKIILAPRPYFLHEGWGAPSYSVFPNYTLKQLALNKSTASRELVVLEIPPFKGAPGYRDPDHGTGGRFEEATDEWRSWSEGEDHCWNPPWVVIRRLAY